MTPRIDHARVAPGAMQAMMAVETYARQSGLDHGLLDLVKLRASYMNGCAYCVDMHTKEARARGETEQRLYGVAVWHDTPFYSPRERTALAWTEAVTRLAPGGIPDALFEEAKAEFGEEALVQLTMAIVAINGWNRLSIAFLPEVGSYQAPGNPRQATASH